MLHVDSNKTCVNFEMADSIGKFNHADLVLWGNYDKDCNSNSKVRIKHIIYNSEGYLSRARKHHDNGFRDVPNLDSIRKGFLLENTEMVILFLMGVSQYHVGKYEEAIKCLRYFRNYKFDTEIELTLLYCYLNLNDIKNAKE